MPFPLKFKHLLEPDPATVSAPDSVWLTHAVCACVHDACGWSGWVLDSIFRKTIERYPTGTGDQLLPSQYTDECPRCGKPLFRTGIERRFEPSSDQTPVHGVAGDDYDTVRMEYE